MVYGMVMVCSVDCVLFGYESDSGADDVGRELVAGHDFPVRQHHPQSASRQLRQSHRRLDALVHDFRLLLTT